MKCTSLCLFGLVFFLTLSCAIGSFTKCVTIDPDSLGYITVELGKEFTAFCYIHNDEYSSDDVTWSFKNFTIPRESYTKINKSVVALTVNISKEMNNPLTCETTKQTFSDQTRCMYGIYLEKGYPPLKPKNLKCIAHQDGTSISNKLNCSWDPGSRDPILNTSYTLHASSTLHFSQTSYKYLTSNQTVTLNIFPNHMMLTVWVVAQNKLGSVTSDKLFEDAEYFVKPNPPANVRIIPDSGFSNSLIVNWTHPIHETVFKVKYHIRYCKAGSSVWQEISQNLTEAYIESFRLQVLQPYTDYVVQVRCIHYKGLGYWSDWSPNSTARTPEGPPKSKPVLWRVYEEDTVVKLIWKDPVKSNGKILGYDLKIDEDGRSKRHFITSKEYRLTLKGEKTLVTIIANNSVGVSPPTALSIPRLGTKLPRVEQVNYSMSDELLWITWLPAPPLPRHRRGPPEYVIELVSVLNKEIDWQRVPSSVSAVFFKDVEPFKRYNISVYPIYQINNYSLPGTPGSKQIYLQEQAPLRGPVVNVTATGKNIAQLKWDEIPIDDQQGFITNYTIIYKTGNKEKRIVVFPTANTYTWKLTGLDGNSHYVVSIMVSNQKGSVRGPGSNFYTKKYDDGEIDVIVVVVCLSFLFLVLFIMFIIIRKKELIKRRFWPQVPDPSHSTIANWSPDCPNKPDTPKESILTEVSVVEVDDGKSFCDEDKVVMPLKKDFSEERSSGIGGSSGMSTPRQSVSSNDEADSGQTTASTVQYSAVVSSGYKGQTPGTAAMFSRSESTQPLLECEENSEHLSEASSNDINSYFKRRKGLEQLHMDEVEEPSFGSLSFSPMEEEDSPTLTEDPPGPAPSYMPQQSGYRPQ